MKRLILGGECSGKSAYALQLLEQTADAKCLAATARALDGNMRERIAAHRTERSADIVVHETDHRLAQELVELKRTYGAVLVDSLDFWLFDVMAARNDIEHAVAELVEAVNTPGKAGLTLVSCEIGLGPVAATAETRRFVRCMGRLNSALAAVCDEVVFVVAGRGIVLPES